MPRAQFALAAALALLFAGCDKKDDKPAAGEASAKPPGPGTSRWDKRSDDPVVGALQAFVEERKLDTSEAGWRLRVPRPPKQKFPAGKKYLWSLRTNHGTARVLLRPDSAPMHATSTIYLTTIGFYDGLRFHRVIEGFMAQGGCPKGDGTGGPAYQYESEIDARLRHDRPRLLSMANAGEGTDGSQFFLTFAPAPWLDGKHTIFGEVVEGNPTLDAIEALAGPKPSGVPPRKPVVIEKATIDVE